MKRNKIRHIQFAQKDPYYDKSIVPARTTVPNWYKEIPLYGEGHSKNRVPYPKTMKACVPFLEALTIGYTITLYTDLGVEVLEDGNVHFTWSKSVGDVVQVRTTDGTESLPVPAGHYSHRFAWFSNTAFFVPKGYSFLVTHPLNRSDLPFYTLTGIMDGPFLTHGGELPFFLREGFEGIIPQGTPIAQIIPFKQENWTSEWVPELYQKARSHWWWSNSTVVGWYKKNIWKKKLYN